ncbi:thiol-disulfide isomerase [Pseudomonas gingeri]|uniref:Thiol-disulfide isomerase n=2 Tax=Pseudomonas gingeri TaxID=117681 RepID=A0A7Y8BV58_9PSED|nr:thiol-disulfide isomerase [Pseudomonas gingeri]
MASYATFEDTIVMPQIRHDTLLAGLLALICAMGLWFAYDWFQDRYIRAFSEQTALFAGDSLSLPAELAGPGPIRLVHFWDPACPCNVGNQQHLGELIERFGPLGVQFYSVQKPGTHGQLPATLSAIKALPGLPEAEHLTVSPAVAIWDRDGKLAYFGPYSQGATCNSSNSFIEPILQALSEGRAVNATHNMAVGCYCPWLSSP